QEPQNLAEVLWNSEEAFLIIGQSRLGWITNPIGLVKQMFATLSVDEPSDHKTDLIVVSYRPPRVEKKTVFNASYGTFALIEGQLCGPDGRWTGAGFEPLTEPERRAYQAFEQEHHPEGWQKKERLLNNGQLETLIPMKLGGNELRIAVRKPSPMSKTIEIELQAAG